MNPIKDVKDIFKFINGIVNNVLTAVDDPNFNNVEPLTEHNT